MRNKQTYIGNATMSADGLYRYVLWRQWAEGPRNATFIMLNPSTANATEDDATIRRCMASPSGRDARASR